MNTDEHRLKRNCGCFGAAETPRPTNEMSWTKPLMNGSRTSPQARMNADKEKMGESDEDICNNIGIKETFTIIFYAVVFVIQTGSILPGHYLNALQILRVLFMI